MNKIEIPSKPKTARQIRSDYAAEKAQREVARLRRAERWAGINRGFSALGRALRVVIIFLFLLVIAAFAGWVSFHHIRDLALLARWDMATASALPVVIDLTLIIASMQLRRVGITPTARFIARLSMLTGLLASLGANVLHGWISAPAGLSSFDMGWQLILSGLPVGGLLAATEMLTHTHKSAKAKARKASLLRRVLTAWVARLEGRLTPATTAAVAASAAPVAAAVATQEATPVPTWTAFEHPVVALLS